MFLKIVLADTDEKLEKAFATFLAPVLLKLGSSKEVVKNKVNLMNYFYSKIPCTSIFPKSCFISVGIH